MLHVFIGTFHVDTYVYFCLIIHNRLIVNQRWKSKVEDIRINCLLFNAMKFMLIIYVYFSHNSIKDILELHRFFFYITSYLRKSLQILFGFIYPYRIDFTHYIIVTQNLAAFLIAARMLMHASVRARNALGGMGHRLNHSAQTIRKSPCEQIVLAPVNQSKNFQIDHSNYYPEGILDRWNWLNAKWSDTFIINFPALQPLLYILK